MKSVGFPISHKENEKRRAVIPGDISTIQNRNFLFFETGYGDVLGYEDKDYINAGANICTRDEALLKDIICDPKVGDADYLERLHDQTLFGWIHAIQNKDITDRIVAGRLTAYAWEDMFENGRHCFWRNNEIAGEAAVFHAYMCHGIFPYHTKAAVLGGGNTARGAIKTLNYLGAEVIQYGRKTEELFRQELSDFDVVVNCVLWDTDRKDHIICKSDLSRMKRNSLIIDISCDRNGGVETSVPTTINNPIYRIDGITHYVVDHTPALFWKTTSESLSAEVVKYIDYLIGGVTYESEALNSALIIDRGQIVDRRIVAFQNR